MVEPPHPVAVPTTVCSFPLSYGHRWFIGPTPHCFPAIWESKFTMYVISQRFWWPTMESEVREYIEACSVCARNKTSSQAHTGLLQPLPIPSSPWSDISMDFVTGLPVSQGNTTVLTVINSPSLCPGSGRNSADSSELQPAWHRVTILKLTARPNTSINNWKPASDVWCTRIPRHGANTWSGLSMLTIHYPPLLLVYLHFIVP